MDATEKKIVGKLVDTILARGLRIDVWEGEDYAIRDSRNRPAIMAALGSTDHDTLHVSSPNARHGLIVLIWGNGEDLISDHSDNATINAIVDSLELA